MSKFLLVFLLILINQIILFSQEFNYNNGNGTIIEQKIENGKQITTRKHEDRFELFSVDSNEWHRTNEQDKLFLLEEPKAGAAILFKLPEFPVLTWINTILFRYEKNLKDDTQNSWLYVKTDDGKIGWLYLGIYLDPYNDGIWSIEETITIKNREWTIRKMTGELSVWKILNVNDKPGFDETRTLYRLVPTTDSPQLNVKILSITEEKDTVDGLTDYWVKIEDENNRTGWIFGGYTSVERGGPKYRIPNVSISFEYWFP